MRIPPEGHGDAGKTIPLDIVPSMSEETCSVLRNRLRAVTLVLTLALVWWFLRHLLDVEGAIRSYHLLVLLIIVVSCAVLSSPVPLKLRHLRLIELSVAVATGFFSLAADMLRMVPAAEVGDGPAVVSANISNYFSWSILILVYGVFMPNDWRRATVVLIPAAFIPYLVTLAVMLWKPDMATALQEHRFDMPIPTPFLAAFTSIYAAHVIHSGRLATYRLRHFAQYRLTRLIGSGGMGEVYEGQHVLLKRPCAVKLIRPDKHDDPKALQRFEREVQATAKLSHWHTIDIYDYGQTMEGIFYYVMELLPGMNLADLVTRYGPIPSARAVHFLRQACGALQEAHDEGLIHRDLKPANLFAAQRGGAYDVTKVLDFGMVREIQVQGDPGLTAENTVGGTPLYMSPEQCMASAEVDARCDIYSLGATAYYMLTGRPPFVDSSAMLLLLAHTKEPVVPPSQLRAEIPKDLEAVVLRCLEKSPADRFQRADELGEALSRCACADGWTQKDAAAWWQSHTDETAKTRPATLLS